MTSKREQLERKVVRSYWLPCSDGKGNVNWSQVDADGDFSHIPLNSRGFLKEFTVGNLRDIVKIAFDVAEKHAIQKCIDALVNMPIDKVNNSAGTLDQVLERLRAIEDLKTILK